MPPARPSKRFQALADIDALVAADPELTDELIEEDRARLAMLDE